MELVGASAGRRHVSWDGFFNARELGGLPTADGKVTRFGAFIRSADLRFVTERGWLMAVEAGLRTIVDLRNVDEIRVGASQQLTRLSGSAMFPPAAHACRAPAVIDGIEIPLEDIADTDFWRQLNRDGLNGTPLCYRPFLDRKPERCAAVFTALAKARGTILFHCGAGRDRAGLVALLLLALAGAEPDAIVEDYNLSAAYLTALFDAMGSPDQGPVVEAAVAAHGTTARHAILATLEGLDAHAYLRAAGVSETDVRLIRDRLLG
jgi:hypothetical protein